MKTKCITLFTAVLLLSFACFKAEAQSSAQLDINNINARINASISQFMSPNGAGFEVPKDSLKHTIYSSSLWIGGIGNSSAIHFAMGDGFATGPLNTQNASIDSATMVAWDRVWEISFSEINQFIACHKNPASCPGYTIPQSIASWPAHGDTTLGQSYFLAPFVDVNQDGQYNLANGDYPLIRGDKAIFFIISNPVGAFSPPGGLALGIELHCMAYAFDCPSDSAFSHSLFFHYRAFNRSLSNYTNTFIGVNTDMDIGYPYDDFIGSDVKRGCFYGYNGPAIDGTGKFDHYGQFPPAQAVCILAGPWKNADGIDNPKLDSLGNPLCNESINGLNFGDNIPDNERLGLTGFVIPTYPSALPLFLSASDYYMIMNGYWADSVPIHYGGSGHPYKWNPAYGPRASFMYPGDSDSCNWGTGGLPPNGPQYWTELTANNTPYDRRGQGVSGPFTFLSGDVQELDIAYVYGRSTGYGANSIEVMKSNIDVVRDAFIKNLTPCGKPMITSAGASLPDKQFPKVKLFPNPANDHISIEIENEKDECFSISVYDMSGRQCLLLNDIKTNAGKQLIKLDVSPLKRGLYLVTVLTSDTIHQTKLMIAR